MAGYKDISLSCLGPEKAKVLCDCGYDFVTSRDYIAAFWTDDHGARVIVGYLIYDGSQIRRLAAVDVLVDSAHRRKG